MGAAPPCGPREHFPEQRPTGPELRADPWMAVLLEEDVRLRGVFHFWGWEGHWRPAETELAQPPALKPSLRTTILLGPVRVIRPGCTAVEGVGSSPVGHLWIWKGRAKLGERLGAFHRGDG